MEAPNNKGDSDATGHLMPPSNTSSARNGFHLAEALAKRVTWTALWPPTSQDIVKAWLLSSA